MKLIEAINAIDELKPNTYTQSQKIKWLSELDGSVKRSVIDTHEGSEEIEFAPYDDNTPLGTELLVYFPYEDVYIRWLEAKIDYSNGEYARYNNSVIRYNEVYKAYTDDYTRTHVPKGRNFKYF